MTPSITWRQALAWRMGRHMLDPIGDLPAETIVSRLCGVQAQVMSSAEIAVRVRQREPRNGEVAAALTRGDLIKTWAMRGTLHLLAVDDGPAFLSVMASGRSWERPSWVKYFGVSPSDWDVLRPAVREALDGAALTREELISAVTARPGFDHLGDALRSGWGTLLKPMAWQGDLCFGPNRGQNVTFVRPEQASRRWIGVPPVDEAAPQAILAYLRAYGPATGQSFANFVARGWLGKRQVDRWFGAIRGELAEVTVEGETCFLLEEDLDGLMATEPSDSVRLLGGFDQWVLGPGTDDPHVVPQARRALVSKQSGWIAPLVVAGGVVSGTWELEGNVARVAWFPECGDPPNQRLEDEAARLSALTRRALTLAVAPA